MILGKYNQAKTVKFSLVAPDGIDLITGATFAAGDIVISKDEGAEANTTNLPIDEGTGYSLVLTATEMSAARISLYVIDQTATKVWLDVAIELETYGNASAEHAFDLDAANVTLAASTHTGAVIPTVSTVTDGAKSATALSTATWTGTRAGYIDELAAANIPADIDTLLTRIVGTLAAGTHNAQTGDTYALANGAAGFVAIDTVVDAIKLITDALPDSGALTTLITHLTDIKGGTFSGATDSLEAIRDSLVTTDGKIDGVKAKSDQMVFTKANELDTNTKSINSATVVGDGNATPWDGA